MSAYFVRQAFPDLRWAVICLEPWQAERMRERGEVVYATPAQAHAVADRLNAKPAWNERWSVPLLENDPL